LWEAIISRFNRPEHKVGPAMPNKAARSKRNVTSSGAVCQRAWLRIEPLEDRTLLSVYPLVPAQIRHAYGFDQVAGDGRGQTIAIVDAYNDPNIFKDLNTFDQTFGSTAGGPTLYSQYGSASSILTVANPQGYTASNSGWAQEISLDVEWAHAIAPAAHILLVEAASSNYANLFGAVDYAANHNSSVVSMSWGGSEFSWETSYDSTFQHARVTFVASAGDAGSVVSYPAASPYVLGVGGTSLNVDSSGNYLGETGWSQSGGGTSVYESKPSYQSGVEPGTHFRSTPDVSFDANPNTGVAVYDSFAGAGGWGQYGGTSAGAPQWAALVAIADQLRVADGQARLNGATQVLPTLYKLQATGFHDVANSAGPRFDLVTGLGSPVVSRVISALVNTTLPSAATVAASTAKSNGGKSGTSPIVAFAAFSATATPPLVLYPSPVPTAPPPVTGSAGPAAVAVPVPSKISASVSQTQESGGGDNGLPADIDLVPDPDGNNSQQDVAQAANGVSLAPLAGPMNAPRAGTFTVAGWREESAAYFADRVPTEAANPDVQPVFESDAVNTDARLSFAAVVLMLGAFSRSSARTKESRTEHSWIEGGSKAKT
jgi:hypothetical protein